MQTRFRRGIRELEREVNSMELSVLDDDPPGPRGKSVGFASRET